MSWSNEIGTITLFVDDLSAAKTFYREVFGAPVCFEDDSSAVLNFGNALISLLSVAKADDLIGPAKVAGENTGSRVQLTIDVEDVDAMFAQLSERGVEFVNGPIDRPHGIRTASFYDPSRHVWEIASSS